jgi:hypothetical protein
MLKVTRAGAMLAVLSFCTVFTACNNTDPLKDFVEQDVKLNVKSAGSQVLASGSLNFTEVYYTTDQETVCDHVECGGYQTQCYGGGEVCSGGRQVCTGGGQVCTPVRRCTGSGCTEDQVCHTEPGSCHTEGEVCRTEPPVCSQVYVSRTCDTNCRLEPVTHEHDDTITSPITVSLKGVTNAGDVQGLHLGVKTNSKFVAAFDDPTQRPKGAEDLWNSLSKTDKTILVGAAKGLKLAPNQNFLVLPADFKPGDAVSIEAQFEPSSNSGTGLSAVGTSVDFPALEFNRQ